MFINIISIDPSLSCTALIVNDVKYVFCSDYLASNKKGYTKWFKEVENLIDINIHKKISSKTLEIEKMISYDQITDNILYKINKNLSPDTKTKILIEGYSQSSHAGPLVDLVTFGTLLRNKLFKNISTDISILPPLSLKLEAAKLTYQAIKKGSKFEYRNNEGISGGKFTKHDIFKSLIDNDSFFCEWVEFLRKNKNLLYRKSIPKPIEDMNDAKILYEYAKTYK